MKIKGLETLAGIGLATKWRCFSSFSDQSIVLFGQVWNTQETVVTSDNVVATYKLASWPFLFVSLMLPSVPGKHYRTLPVSFDLDAGRTLRVKAETSPLLPLTSHLAL